MLNFFTHLRFRQFLALFCSLFILLLVLDEIEMPVANVKASIPTEPIYLSAVDVKAVEKMPKLLSLAKVEPVKRLQIIAQVAGQVISVTDDFKRGLSLPDDRQLMSIDPLRAKAAVAQAQAGYIGARIEYKKTKIRYSGNKLMLSLAKSQLHQSATQLELAEQQLQNAVVKMPVAGEISAIHAYLGEFISLGQQLATVLPKRDRQIVIRLSESDFAKLDLQGLAGDIQLNSLDDKRQWTAKITGHSQQTRGLQRSLFIKLKQSVHADPLHGQFLQAHLPLNAWPKIYVLPESAMTFQGEIWSIDQRQKVHKRKLDHYHISKNKVYFYQADDPVSQAVLYPLDSLVEGMQISVLAEDK